VFFQINESTGTTSPAGQIADFVSGRAQKLSLVSRQNPATAIRSLLRFLTGEGLIRAGLAGAVPPIWRSKHATVPRHVSCATVGEHTDAMFFRGPRCDAQTEPWFCSRLVWATSQRSVETPFTGSRLDRWQRAHPCRQNQPGESAAVTPRMRGGRVSPLSARSRGRSAPNGRCFSGVSPRILPLRGNGFMAKLVNRLLRQAGIGAPCSGALRPAPHSSHHHGAQRSEFQRGR